MLKYSPAIFDCFLTYFVHRSILFWPSIISTIVCPIIDDNSNNVDPMTPILAFELLKRLLQKWKAYRSEEFGPYRNQDVARGMIRSLCEY